LFTIAEDLKKMELVIAVPEADIGRVAVGQSATFSVDAWPTRTYTAAVKKVSFGAAGTATSAASNANPTTTSGVVTYSTELEVNNEDLSLRPGMTASVDISIINKPGVITVPNAALRFDPVAAAEIGKPDQTKRTLVQSLSPGGGRRWRGNAKPPISSPSTKGPRVWLLKDGNPIEVLVKIGITDGRFTEIVDDSLAVDSPVIVSVKPAAS
jgi:HlyD family secretion protein